MDAIVTSRFNGRPDDSAETLTFLPGDTVRGDLARVAVDNGWADFVNDEHRDGEKALLPDFEAMSVAELKDYAEGRAIALGTASKKAEIIEAIKAAQA